MASSQWQYVNVDGLNQPGGNAIGGGGGYANNLALTSTVVPMSGFRDILDARRAMMGSRQTPQAQYPDGYLGNVRSRREDRLLGAIQSRLTQRSYQRGVHKGERLDPQDYYWPEVVLTPIDGIKAEAKGLKWSAVGSTPQEQILRLGGGDRNQVMDPAAYDLLTVKLGLADPARIDPIRSAQMQRLLPTWR